MASLNYYYEVAPQSSGSKNVRKYKINLEYKHIFDEIRQFCRYFYRQERSLDKDILHHTSLSQIMLENVGYKNIYFKNEAYLFKAHFYN